jgi:hypothetical protein
MALSGKEKNKSKGLGAWLKQHNTFLAYRRPCTEKQKAKNPGAAAWG